MTTIEEHYDKYCGDPIECHYEDGFEDGKEVEKSIILKAINELKFKESSLYLDKQEDMSISPIDFNWAMDMLKKNLGLSDNAPPQTKPMSSVKSVIGKEEDKTAEGDNAPRNSQKSVEKEIAIPYNYSSGANALQENSKHSRLVAESLLGEHPKDVCVCGHTREAHYENETWCAFCEDSENECKIFRLKLKFHEGER